MRVLGIIAPIGTILAVCLSSMAVSAQANGPQQALALERQGNFAAASTIWRKILQGHPNDALVYAHLGLDEARQDHYPAAIHAYRQALALDPKLGGLKLDLALSYFKLGHFDHAIPLLKEQLHQQPGNLRLNILLGMAHYGAQEYAKAVPYLKAAAAHEPQSAAIRLPLAQACLWARQFECVLATYKQILALNANSAEADMLAGEAYSAKGDTPAAVRQFQAAVRANPREPEVHFGLGYLLWTERKFSAAATEFRAELSNSPQDGQSLAYLGDSLMHLGKQAEALQALRHAVALKSSLELAHLDLGIIDAAKGDKSAAVNQFRTAVSIDPKDADPRWRLARLYQSMGREKEAQAEFAQVRKMKQKSVEDLYMKMAGSPTARSAHRAQPSSHR